MTVVALIGAVGLCLATSPALAPEIAAAQAAAEARLDAGEPAAAIDLLKAALERTPDATSLALLLARAYLVAGNEPWAGRTLAELYARDPEACAPQLWLGWLHLRQGALVEAREWLSEAPCTEEPDRARRALLLALLAEAEPAGGAAPLAEVDAAGALYPEDRRALLELWRRRDPSYLPPWSFKLDLQAGWAHNARAGSPVDPAANVAAASPTAQTALWLRLAPPLHGLRPVIEGDLRATGYSAPAGRPLSFALGGVRPGLRLAGDGLRGLTAYHYEAVLLAGGDRYDDGPNWFYDAHRGELELELGERWTVFGGAGRRSFRELGRGRYEVDGGVGVGFAPGARWRLTLVALGRWQDAENRAYDLWGGTLLAAPELRLPQAWLLRLGALAAYDRYPHSRGYFDPAKPNRRRSDLLARVSASLFMPPRAESVRLGLTYELAARNSSTAPYDFLDHRVLLKLSWSTSDDPRLPPAVAPPGHVPLDHGLAAGELGESVQELLRQNEAAQRSQSCVE